MKKERYYTIKHNPVVETVTDTLVIVNKDTVFSFDTLVINNSDTIFSFDTLFYKDTY